LVHISELAHHRVFAVKNVVNDGDEVDVKILAIDRPAQRIALSLKATQAQPEPKRSGDSEREEPADQPPRPLAVAPRNEPLKGGRDRKSGGESVGLNW
jgi:small subunit ribosomal protein S1